MVRAAALISASLFLASCSNEPADDDQDFVVVIEDDDPAAGLARVAELQRRDFQPVEEPAGQDMCRQSYCPCDESDPDYGGADAVVCRNLRNGVPVGDDEFTAAANLRDARRQLREFGY